MCRERAAQRPQVFAQVHRLPGPLCGPFAAQGRSYRDRMTRLPIKATCHHLDYTPCTAAVLPGHWPAKECLWLPIPQYANAARSA